MSAVARWLEHVTLTTGHSRRSYADEVSDAALVLCRELVAQLDGDDPTGFVTLITFSVLTSVPRSV